MKSMWLIAFVFLGCGSEVETGAVNVIAHDACAAADEYAACASPNIPGGGACIGGACSCYADAQCADDDPCTNAYCADGSCVADDTCD